MKRSLSAFPEATARLKRGGGEISGSRMLAQTNLLHHIGGASQTILNDWQQNDVPKYVSGNPFHFFSRSEKALLALSISISVITGGVLVSTLFETPQVSDADQLLTLSLRFRQY